MCKRAANLSKQCDLVGVVARNRSPIPLPGTIRMTVTVIIVLAVLVVILAMGGYAEHTISLIHVFGLLSFPFGVFLFFLAQLIYVKTLRIRESVLREEDRRNSAQVISTVNLCSVIVQGVLNRDEKDHEVLGTLAVRHVAESIGLVRAQHGHLLSESGRFFAENIRDLALAALGEGGSCKTPTFSRLRQALRSLGGEIMSIDSPELVERRRRASGTKD